MFSQASINILEGNPNVADEAAGTTPLLVATREGKKEIVQALMGKRADLMMADLDGDNPLMVAISQGHNHIVPCLLPICFALSLMKRVTR